MAEQHMGQIVDQYFQNVASPRFDNPPDREIVGTDGPSDGLTLRHYDLPGNIHLTAIKGADPLHPLNPLRYMRLLGWGAAITNPAERDMIGISRDRPYRDIVVACPPTPLDDFHIVPDAIDDFGKVLSGTKRSGLMVTEYRPGIYLCSDETDPYVDMRGALPQTTRALARLAMPHEFKLTGIPPTLRPRHPKPMASPASHRT